MTFFLKQIENITHVTDIHRQIRIGCITQECQTKNQSFKRSLQFTTQKVQENM